MFGCSRIIIVKRKKKAQGDRGMKARADQEANWYMRQRNEKRMRLTSASQGTERSNASLGAAPTLGEGHMLASICFISCRLRHTCFFMSSDCSPSTTTAVAAVVITTIPSVPFL
jgi:hypothetical protein